MKPVKIYPVKTDTEKKEFLSFPWRVYKDNPYWVPPLFKERIDFLNPEKNPFYDHAEVALFAAKRGDEVVGTIAAFTNHGHNKFQDENIGFFGFFEVLEDGEAAAALLRTAEEWVKVRGHDAIRGPAQFSTNEECGLLVDGFDDSPRMLMTYNPPYYVDLIEANGYSNAMDLYAYELETAVFDPSHEEYPEKLVRVVDKVMARDKLSVRRINMKKFDEEVMHVKKIYNSSWAKNWGFVPMTDAEINKLADELEMIIDPDLVYIVENEGEVVGFGLALPDMNQPLLKAHPRPTTPEWWTMLKLLWHWKVRKNTFTWVRVWALGVLPEYRGGGVDGLLYIKIAKAALEKGYQKGEMSWILANNEMMNRAAQSLGGRVYKTYRLYEKPV